jgi:hypothetical protein
MSNKFLNQNIVWAIKDDVRQLILELQTELGMDPDLALGIIENVLPEDRIYNLPTEDSDE